MKEATSVALITGASSGIGHEFAKILARDGYNLVIVAREQDKLAEVARELETTYGVRVLAITKDLTDPAAPQAIMDEIERKGWTVDILINNAGFGLSGPFADSDVHQMQSMMQVNMVAVTQLARLVLPGMLARKSGKILNVASTAAFQPGPLMAVYYASKGYVLSFSEALSEEVRGTGVTVTCLCPGPTRTGFQDRASLGRSILFRRNLTSPEQVARIGYQAMLAGTRVVIPTLSSRLGAWLVKFLPRALVLRGVKRLHES